MKRRKKTKTAAESSHWSWIVPTLVVFFVLMLFREDPVSPQPPPALETWGGVGNITNLPVGLNTRIQQAQSRPGWLATGFFVKYKKRPYFVSADHCFRKEGEGLEYAEIYPRLLDGTLKTNSFRLFDQDGKPRWLVHPRFATRVDIGVMPVEFDLNGFSYLDFDRAPPGDSTATGSGVALGFPFDTKQTNRLAMGRMVPDWRWGELLQLTHELNETWRTNIDGQDFYVQGANLKFGLENPGFLYVGTMDAPIGMSGGPAFWVARPPGNTMRLVGVNSKRPNGPNPKWKSAGYSAKALLEILESQK